MTARRVADWLCGCGFAFAGTSLVAAIVFLLAWHFTGAPGEPVWAGNALMAALGGMALCLVGMLLDGALDWLKGRRRP